jgi:hypothetical protein
VAPLSKQGVADRELVWDGICRLGIFGGRLIAVESLRAATPEDLALAVSGSGLALALEARGHLVLHGSCVAIEGRGVCLLGPSGAGKSTLAAALQAAGHTLVSDAMTALDLEEAPRAFPGWGTLKLWPTTVSRLGLESLVTGRVHGESNKQLCLPQGRVAAGLVPIQTFVIVGPGEASEPSWLGPAEGVMALMQNAYLVDDMPAAAQPALLKLCARVVSSSSVARLDRGLTLDQLDVAVATLERLALSPAVP